SIHGGGFISGDKADGKWVTFCTLFAKMGYVTASINYRLQPRGYRDKGRAVTEAMYDAKAAVRYFRAHAEEYRIDTDRIAIIGSSAGAITALHVTYLREPRYEGDSGNPGFSSNVTACVDLWGGLYSNITEIDPGEPPVLIIHGTLDEVVPYSEAENISQRCKEVGVYCSLHPLVGEGHAPWDKYKEFLPWIIEFLYQYCANKEETMEMSFDTPIGLGVGDESHLEFLNERLREEDILAVKPHLMSLLDEIKTGRKTLVFNANYYSEVEDLIEEALEKNVEIIGYNLEGPYTIDEMIEQERRVYNLTREHGLLFMFGPTLHAIMKNYEVFTQYTDMILVQVQSLQTMNDFRSRVERIIDNISTVNPDVEIWIQLSINPPGNRNLTVDEFLEDIYEVEDLVDGIWIFYLNSRWSDVKEILGELRPKNKGVDI
ncbi:MAG TPA: alpha/beta hydrolase, partial [Thermoplasmatales archaeon]|nr:alpha/beta hydrolase [Thermoplasmatales archaeon]